MLNYQIQGTSGSGGGRRTRTETAVDALMPPGGPASGYICFLDHPALPGLLKVSKTTTVPGTDAAKPRGATAGLQVYAPRRWFLVRDVDACERDVHRRLAEYLEASAFFRLSLAKAVTLAMPAISDRVISSGSQDLSPWPRARERREAPAERPQPPATERDRAPAARPRPPATERHRTPAVRPAPPVGEGPWAPTARKRSSSITSCILALLVLELVVVHLTMYAGFLVVALVALSFVPDANGLPRELLRLNPARPRRFGIQVAAYILIGLALVLFG
jgi:hypothetical protein